ncbi:aminopeptidase P family protein [Candidatus Daviesbacteria bacterium]|nr:aminopeptidase P family protein [Candidatus Daviesbacteria bacterium]
MLKRRLQELRQRLIKEKVGAVWVSDAANISYLSGFTNFSETEREAYIFVGKDFAYLISDARYTEAVKKQVSHLTLFERGHKNPTEKLLKKHEVAILGIEENSLTVQEFKFIKKHFKKIKHFEISRSIKTKEEISNIEKACKIGDLAFEYMLKKLRIGISEKEIANDLENFIKEKNCEFSFSPIIAFGKNSAIPHHQTGPSTLFVRSGQKGQFVLFDFGVKYENYCSDMTRTIVFGKPNEKQKKIYDAVLEAQQRAVEAIEQGERQAAKIFKAAGIDIPHSLGHGIGLQVHEHPSLSPKSKEVLKEGMVFSIEPGIYLPDFGGVRIEDLFVLEKNGLRKLTQASVKIKII